MPRKPLFTKEEIVEKAFNFVRRKGMHALSARDLGAYLGCSSRPIFSVFDSMDDLKEEVRLKAEEFFRDYVKDSVNYTPAFKEYGKRLITLAQKERHLFFLLFLSEEAYKTKSDYHPHHRLRYGAGTWHKPRQRPDSLRTELDLSLRYGYADYIGSKTILRRGDQPMYGPTVYFDYYAAENGRSYACCHPTQTGITGATGNAIPNRQN